MTPTLRVLVAKVGLDGHDRGAKVVARTLRDAGMEVIYAGLRQTPEMIATAALQEDVDVVGLSMHNAAHRTLAPRVVRALRAVGLQTPVVVGGIVPDGDAAQLRAQGVAAVFTPKDFELTAVLRSVVEVVRAAHRLGPLQPAQ